MPAAEDKNDHPRQVSPRTFSCSAATSKDSNTYFAACDKGKISPVRKGRYLARKKRRQIYPRQRPRGYAERWLCDYPPRQVFHDEVVFAEPGDLALLGARTLEELNLNSRTSQGLWSRGLYSLRRQHDQSDLRACEKSNAASATVIDQRAATDDFVNDSAAVRLATFVGRYDILSMATPARRCCSR
jgi:hypothetical protein